MTSKQDRFLPKVSDLDLNEIERSETYFQVVQTPDGRKFVAKGRFGICLAFSGLSSSDQISIPNYAPKFPP